MAVSIHAPARGATTGAERRQRVSNGFNPRPRGGATAVALTT